MSPYYISPICPLYECTSFVVSVVYKKTYSGLMKVKFKVFFSYFGLVVTYWADHPVAFRCTYFNLYYKTKKDEKKITSNQCL